ncbi:DNA cytosine methyltransferase [Paenibacillus sp. J22TS3]|uniref:DNA cytosine methyltransferase n=1 Tax=Paenibacillus sp. J22TS3 TaxID=2807192 RepID=UPI001B0B7BEA|nr:DNA cytosine methyltransferase [Paenibacillus sp. J22TS3]GIP22903.1 restriction endonuclease subunit M [Paenibacillus sp. J22TS3]
MDEVMKERVPGKKSILSLFSGAGFLDLGFLNEGFQVERALEVNEQFIYGYNKAFEEYAKRTSNLYWSKGMISHKHISETMDLSDKKNIISISKEFKGITGIIGGPPCQDYSIAGKNLGILGERGKLIYSYLSFVKKIKPEFIFFENVEGLSKTKDHRESFKLLLETLDQLGYKVWHKIINPLNYGFPQDRPRIIVVGFKKKIFRKLVRNGYRDNSVERLMNDDKSIFKFPEAKLILPKKSINWPQVWPYKSSVIEHEITTIPDIYKSLMVIQAFKGLTEETPNQNDVFNSYSEKFHYIQEGDTRRKSFKRLHRFRYSPTVAYGNNEVHLHPTEPRRLSVRESLRLQTVPDEFVFPRDLPLTAKFKMISNGVPTKIAELIAIEIKRTLRNYEDCL